MNTPKAGTRETEERESADSVWKDDEHKCPHQIDTVWG